MNRNKLISLLMPIAILLGSCSGSEEPMNSDPKEIAFTVENDNRAQSRASLDHGYTMWVSGLFHDKDNGFYLLENQPFVYNSYKSWWEGKNKSYYYPMNGSIDFVAVATTNSNHKPTLSMTPNAIRRDIADDERISSMTLAFRNSSNQLDGLDDVAVSAITEDHACGLSAQQKVPLNFVHILSNVRFTFNAKTQEAENYIWITGVEIKNAHLTGNVTLTRGTEKPWDITWSDLKEKTTTKIEPNFQPEYSDPEKPFVDFYLPQQSTSGITYSIYYQYRTEDHNTGTMAATGLHLSTPAVLLPGMRHIYNITIKLLPHIAFQVDLLGGDGAVLDTWEVEPTIDL